MYRPALTGLALLGALFCSARVVQAQAGETNFLTSVKTLSCTFPLWVSASWHKLFVLEREGN